MLKYNHSAMLFGGIVEEFILWKAQQAKETYLAEMMKKEDSMTTPATITQERQAVRNKSIADSITGELITQPQFRFVDHALIAAVVRLTVCAISPGYDTDMQAEVADTARHDRNALRQHDTKGDR